MRVTVTAEILARVKAKIESLEDGTGKVEIRCQSGKVTFIGRSDGEKIEQ